MCPTKISTYHVTNTAITLFFLHRSGTRELTEKRKGTTYPGIWLGL
jgi:hypothetical protein